MKVIIQYSDLQGNLFTTKPISKEIAQQFLDKPGMFAKVIKEIPYEPRHIPAHR